MKNIYSLAVAISLVACSPTSMEDSNLIEQELELQNLTSSSESGKSETTTSKDTDQDGINDQADVDIDGDGINDNGTDTDGDGINDASDVDIDNDGIEDNGTDIDEDGINDDNDDDIDGDGIDNDDDEYSSLSDTSIAAAAQQKIMAYIAANYPNQTITEVEIENQSIEIELSGDTNLYFDTTGEFVAMDTEESEANEDHDNDGDNDDDDENSAHEHEENESEENEFQSLANSTLSATVQQQINTYLQTNYPNQTVVEVEVENQKIEIKLNNGIELIFDLNGNFLRLDD